MLAVSEHPETLEQVQQTILNWLKRLGKHKIPLIFAKLGASDVLCFTPRKGSGLKVETVDQRVALTFRQTCLKLNLDRFVVTTAIEGDKVRLQIKAVVEPEHRYFYQAWRRIAETKHPAFQSRVMRAFINLEEDLPSFTIEQATGANTDFLVALEAITLAPGTSRLVDDDPLLAARIRGLKRKKQMLDVAGGALSSEQVAEVLGISRQAVDKRRSANQLLGLTQGRRGYSYPTFQFEEGKTIPGLEEVLTQMKALDPWMQMIFFTSPHKRLGGKTPIESLRTGLVNEVAEAASVYGEQGAL